MTEEPAPQPETEGPKEKPTVKRLPPAELQKWAVDYLAGRILCSTDLMTGDLAEDARRIGMVFLPLRLGMFAGFDPAEFQKIGMFWAYKRDAGPISADGLPMFMSCNLLHVDDYDIIREPIHQELKRRTEFRIPGLPAEESRP